MGAKNKLMKKKRSQITDEEFMETLDVLYTAAGTLHGRNETKFFLRDLLTPSERLMMGYRIRIGRLLLKKCTYRDIQETLHVGQTTVARVHKWITGLEIAIKNLEKERIRSAKSKIQQIIYK
jgi:uncharacterized protein YerC